MKDEEYAKLKALVAAESMALDVMGRLRAQLDTAHTLLRLLPKLLEDHDAHEAFVRDVSEVATVLRSLSKSQAGAMCDLDVEVVRLETALARL